MQVCRAGKWLKRDYETGEKITFSLGISLAPGGPTLPGIKDGAYDVVTRQMQSHVWLETKDYGFVEIDKYDVGYGTVMTSVVASSRR